MAQPRRLLAVPAVAAARLGLTPHADPYRQLLNGERLGTDRLCLQSLVVALGLFHLVRTWWREGQLALALASVPPLLLSQALVALIARRPGLYARHREPLLIAAFLVHNHTNVLFNLRIHDQWRHHGGSSLRLLALILLSSSAQWLLIGAVAAPLVLLWATLLLGAGVAQTLWSTRAVCARILEAPGIEQPMRGLFGALETAHSMGVVLPTLGMAGKLAQTPHQQCRAVMAYLTVAVGGLLPFCILERREATARAHAGAAAASQLPPGQQEAERQRWLSALLADDALFSPVHAYLASCLLFMPATAAAA